MSKTATATTVERDYWIVPIATGKPDVWKYFTIPKSPPPQSQTPQKRNRKMSRLPRQKWRGKNR